MREGVNRRQLVSALAALTVVGFDPGTRRWLTSASAAPAALAIPALDGQLFLDAEHLAAAADDFGHLVHRTPAAVLLPGSVSDVVKMVRYAKRHGLQLAMRGQGHAQYGQAQAPGIVIDSSSLDTIHRVGPGGAQVDAGVQWGDLVQAAFAEGLTPPVLTDYMGLAVGGTLSVGGIGGAMQRFGIQADNVLELEVVTADGELVSCSPCQRASLFEAVLAGMGQFALIVRATLRLVPAQSQARVFNLFYDDVQSYVADQLRLVDDGRFDYLEGQVVARDDGPGWRYMIEAASFYTAPTTPNNSRLLRGLSDDLSRRSFTDPSYLDFVFRLDPLIAQLKALGVWGFPHPWLSLFVPASEAADYVGGVVSGLTLDDTGQGPILFYPVNRRKITRPFFRLPRERISFAFNILRTAPPVPEVQAAMVASNRALYDRAAAIGGARYASGAIPFTPADWRAHFGEVWRDFVHAKQRFDPEHTLTPGPGIFD